MYGLRVRICMTDTDSLLYNTFTDYLYKDMANSPVLFDTSEYLTTRPCYFIITKKNWVLFKLIQNVYPH